MSADRDEWVGSEVHVLCQDSLGRLVLRRAGLCAVDKSCKPVVLSGIAYLIYFIGLVISCFLIASAATEAIAIHVVRIIYLISDRTVGTYLSHCDACTLDVGSIYGVSFRGLEYRTLVTCDSRQVLIPCLCAVGLASVEQICHLTISHLCV